jgi:hypothetical protein
LQQSIRSLSARLAAGAAQGPLGTPRVVTPQPEPTSRLAGFPWRRKCVGSRVLSNAGDISNVHGLDKLSEANQVGASVGRTGCRPCSLATCFRQPLNGSSRAIIPPPLPRPQELVRKAFADKEAGKKSTPKVGGRGGRSHQAPASQPAQAQPAAPSSLGPCRAGPGGVNVVGGSQVPVLSTPQASSTKPKRKRASKAKREDEFDSEEDEEVAGGLWWSSRSPACNRGLRPASPAAGCPAVGTCNCLLHAACCKQRLWCGRAG